MTLQEFARQSAKEYLHSIVFVDDEIYDAATGHPTEPLVVAARFKAPFAAEVAQPEPPAPSTEEKPAYHPKHLMESFARDGMVCALYEPKKDFDTDSNSELFRLCARADVVIFDWDLYKRDGQNLLPLISNLVSDSQNAYPHHVRLFAIYTTKPNLGSVASAIYEHLKAANLETAPLESLTLNAGATRIIILGKPGVVSRPIADKPSEVAEANLASRIIEEFSRMHEGILPSYALHGLAGVRRNSKRILDKFHDQMDGPFLLHRALLLDHEDAFEQLPELIAEEALAVLLDDQVPLKMSADIATNLSSSLPLNNLTWPPANGKNPEQKLILARKYLAGGAAAIRDDFKVKAQNEQYESFHQAMGCADTEADKRLAALFAVRTQYLGTKVPELGFGTVVKSIPEDDAIPEYSICLMPLCDSIRLGEGVGTSFPFWRLKPIGGGAGGRGIVVQSNGAYVSLIARGKPREMLWLATLLSNSDGIVTAVEEQSSYIFSAGNSKFEWVAQLKPAHAQRIAHDIGQSFSRVAVVEAEWLRLITERK